MGLGVLQQGKNFLLDGDLVRVRQFVAVAGKNLDAIVGPGIVRRRDDHARSVLARARQIGHSWRGDHAGAVDFDSAGGQPVRHPVGNPRAGFPRVLPDHYARRSTRTLQIMAQRAADHVRAVLGQGKFAGDAANPIGAEELSRLGCHAELKMLISATPASGRGLFHDNRDPHRIGVHHLDQGIRNVSMAHESGPVHGSARVHRDR